ncbi:hypothetical protein QE383_002997 [Pseudoxanthomonas winnipegensis]|uniref:Uncharacterized protein n=1 Tax=Pseudoxanthomonas winnipegensis TaxID=2480810 RepID=A0AAW8GE22_9GAMM|nr:hypothetical protein [Pseudoxanthomonas winnipegensis]MDQ1120689.1 hypothetical protein [Pseudoxanthomonas winnipegensis]
MYADLFFDFPGASNIVDAASRAYSAIGVKDFVQRESENYIEGVYFTAESGDAQIEIAMVDDEDAGDLRFWLSLDSSLEGAPFERLVECLAKGQLLSAGAKVARVYDFGKKTMKMVGY